jgi:hypothetical protein
MSEAFLAFWSRYPKKVAKKDAWRAWQKLTDEEIARIPAALDWQIPTWHDPEFMKHPATWLNKGCFDDEPPVVAAKPKPVRVEPEWARRARERIG